MSADASAPLVILSLEQMAALGTAISAQVRQGDIITLSGSLGAGKTTLARAIIASLGYQSEVPSPTFAILQYYDPPEIRMPLVHADFYRLADAQDLEELGLETGADAPILIAEWAENIGGLSGNQTLQLQIGFGDASARNILIHPGADWIDRWNIILKNMQLGPNDR